MKRRYAIITAALMAFMGGGLATNASALTWVVSPTSPAGGTMVFLNTDIVAVTDIGDAEDATQTEAIYGAGFELPGADAYEITFDADLGTWDSFDWDSFVVNINQTGYYWDLGLSGNPTVANPAGGAPVTECGGVLPGCTWAWGGADYGNGSFETLSPLTSYTLTLDGGSSSPYYVSMVLDTATTPADDGYPSYGSFHVGSVTEVVPEPSTLLMLGSGLVGFGIWMKRKKA
jgi:hypothetical protein